MTGGGGNRQDNRQRGNAAQLLEKYKSLARDAQLGGDRVQTEYFLQFADHYYRVLGESRSRFEDQRRGRDEDSDGDEQDESEMVEAEAEAEAEAEVVDRSQRRRGRDREERFERPNQQRANGEQREDGSDAETDERIAFDALPPAIGADEVDQSGEEDTPAPRRRGRRPRNQDGDADIAPAA